MHNWKDSFTRKLFLCFILIFFVVIGAFMYTNNQKITQMNLEKAQLLVEIEDRTLQKQQLLEDMEYYNSDSYIEKVAREQWGYVKPNEILFIIRE